MPSIGVFLQNPVALDTSRPRMLRRFPSSLCLHRVPGVDWDGFWPPDHLSHFPGFGVWGLGGAPFSSSRLRGLTLRRPGPNRAYRLMCWSKVPLGCVREVAGNSWWFGARWFGFGVEPVVLVNGTRETTQPPIRGKRNILRVPLFFLLGGVPLL